MFEIAVKENMIQLTPELADVCGSFYLAGGTALALQLGHRVSVDLDFFTANEFDNKAIIERLQPDRVVMDYRQTLHLEKNGVRITFLFYDVPLVFPLLTWRGLEIADSRDIIAEKFKTVSQRGARKDFCDLYAALHHGFDIATACAAFNRRFFNTGINSYAVLKSLTWFQDADQDPDPVWLSVDYSTEWSTIRDYFTSHAREFKKHLVDSV
jgi:predicted nucleotidyltransferase component of viral defense system